MDVLWFKMSKRVGEDREPFGRFDAGRIFILIDRGDHFQCGYVIIKGGADGVKARGIDAFRADVVALATFGGDRITEDVKSFDDVKLLTVAVNRLEQWWKPGFLAIGDAAHAMSPVGGVGINIALQDAVAAANGLAAALREKRVSDADLAAVQRRRMSAVRITQWVQVLVQNNVIRAALDNSNAMKAPLVVRLLARFAFLRRLPGRMIGMGVRPEHVETQELA